MTKRIRKILWNHSFKRVLSAMTRTATRAGAKAIGKALRAKPKVRKPVSAKSSSTSASDWNSGIAVSVAGAQRYRLFKPPDVRGTERLPLMVMLHGCGQNAEALAASTKMNQIAASKRFLVLYPEQERLSNAQGCWNWYDTRSGRAQREAAAIDAIIDQICLMQQVDPGRIVLAGLSAGASMAALLAIRRPERFRAIAMHSGIAPGVAHSSATAFMAMRGRRTTVAPLPAGINLPALLVVHGSADHVVAPNNGAEAAQRWAAQLDAKPSAPRAVQRGGRYATTVTDYRARGRVWVTFCEVNGLGHAWSGGAAAHAYSDPQGPDASRMIWAFAAKQFAFDAK
jgi:poly(hydroxyalkanoate) depolymerase family esterase